MNINNSLDWVLPDRQACRGSALELAQHHPDESPQMLAQRVVADAKKWGAAAGGATGAAASPLFMVPAAMADVAAMLRIEGHMAGTIAALLDPDSLDHPERFEADVLSVVFPGVVSQALRQIGVRAGQQITRTLIRKYLGEQLIQSVTRLSARYLAVKLSQKAVLTKTVPMVGMGIGAGWNWLEARLVGQRAIRYYQDRSAGVVRKERRLPSIQSIRKRLPGKSQE